MSHPFYHAQSSAKKFGGQPEDYQAIHDWFDATKSHFADPRHRALRHHSLGIFEAEEKFGVTIKNSDGKDVPVRLIGERHVIEDCGRVPTVADWLRCIMAEPWMNSPKRLSRSQETCEAPAVATMFRVRLKSDARPMPQPFSGAVPRHGEIYDVVGDSDSGKNWPLLRGFPPGAVWSIAMYDVIVGDDTAGVDLSNEDISPPVVVLRPPTLYQVRLRADASPTPHEETGAVPQQGEIYDVTDLGNGYPRLRGFPDAARWPRTLYEVLPDSGPYAATHSDVYGTMEFMSNEKAVV